MTANGDTPPRRLKKWRGFSLSRYILSKNSTNITYTPIHLYTYTPIHLYTYGSTISFFPFFVKSRSKACFNKAWLVVPSSAAIIRSCFDTSGEK